MTRQVGGTGPYTSAPPLLASVVLVELPSGTSTSFSQELDSDCEDAGFEVCSICKLSETAILAMNNGLTI